MRESVLKRADAYVCEKPGGDLDTAKVGDLHNREAVSGDQVGISRVPNRTGHRGRGPGPLSIPLKTWFSQRGGGEASW